MTEPATGPNFSIRDATVSDIPLIRELTDKTWPATYASILSADQINYMIGMMYSEAELQRQLNGNHEFVIVLDHKRAVGFAGFERIDVNTYKLHKLYVLPDQQGKGTGKYLIQELIARMKSKGASFMQLNVNRHNKALEFYKRMGFVIIREEDIDIGSGYYMNDYVMEVALAVKDNE